MRPLTVLSMLYRLPAAIRLADAIRWQEVWVHLSAFAFRLACSALDRVRVLLELALCRSKHLGAAGMGFDYLIL